MICPNCRSEIPDQSQTCPYCGIYLQNYTYENESGQYQNYYNQGQQYQDTYAQGQPYQNAYNQEQTYQNSYAQQGYESSYQNQQYQSNGDQTYGDQNYGNQTYGNSSYGNQAYGNQNFNGGYYGGGTYQNPYGYQSYYGYGPQKKQHTLQDSMDQITSKINQVAGGDGAVDLHVKDLFVDVPKKHTMEESELIFIRGTAYTTPDIRTVSAEWPKPWLYSRIGLVLLVTYLVLALGITQFENMICIPGAIIVGSFVMPFCVLVLFFEMNVPGNISFFQVLQVFCVGGVMSMIIAIILSEITTGDLNFIGAMLVGIVEEIAKAVVVAFFIKRSRNCKYILNGVLIGGAVGAGFAAFESAGYAFIVLLYYGNYDAMFQTIVLRGILAPGGHVVWAAISGAAIMIALGQDEFQWGVLFNTKFLSLMAFSIVMHGVWDWSTGVMAWIDAIAIYGVSIKNVFLIAAAWVVLLVLIHRGLEQINKLANGASTTSDQEQMY